MIDLNRILHYLQIIQEAKGTGAPVPVAAVAQKKRGGGSCKGCGK